MTVKGDLLLSSALDGAVEQRPEIAGNTVVLGDDRPDARQFQLPSGDRLSRAAIIAWTAHTLVKGATTPPPPPPPPPAEEPVEEEVSLPDLTPPFIGQAPPTASDHRPQPRDRFRVYWILGAAFALLIGATLWVQRRPFDDNVRTRPFTSKSENSPTREDKKPDEPDLSP